jgi:hypothetical protein
MKKVVFGIFLFIIAFLNAEGQWYLKQYHVSDINQLSKAQLELSIVKAKNNILTASLVGGIGAISWWLLRTANEAIITSYVCAGVFVGGAIVSLIYLQRIAKIKTALKINYPTAPGSISISPAVIKNSYTQTFSSGISLTFTF